MDKMDQKKQLDQVNNEEQLSKLESVENEKAGGDNPENGNMPKKAMNSTNKKLILAAVIEACILLLLSFAWYYYVSNRNLVSEDREVMVPYYLYLLDETQSEYFQLQVVNMHPDEKKQVVVCVSNKDKDKSELSYSVGRESEFNYELEFAYTQNVPLDYTVYELKPIPLDQNGNVSAEDQTKELVYMDSGTVWEKVSDSTGKIKPLELDQTASSQETKDNNTEMYGDTDVVNRAQYDIYKKDAGGNLLQLKTTLNGTQSEFEYDYYLIEITWKPEIKTFSQYLKETDLVYVIVKAVQPRPEVGASSTD